MNSNHDDILAELLALLRQLADDWEYSGVLDEHTMLVADLGFESLDLVVLGSAVEQHYGKTLPFPEFYAMLGQRPQRDVSIGEWVDFVREHLDSAPQLSVSEPIAP